MPRIALREFKETPKRYSWIRSQSDRKDFGVKLLIISDSLRLLTTGSWFGFAEYRHPSRKGQAYIIQAELHPETAPINIIIKTVAAASVNVLFESEVIYGQSSVINGRFISDSSELIVDVCVRGTQPGQSAMLSWINLNSDPADIENANLSGFDDTPGAATVVADHELSSSLTPNHDIDSSKRLYFASIDRILQDNNSATNEERSSLWLQLINVRDRILASEPTATRELVAHLGDTKPGDSADNCMRFIRVIEASKSFGAFFLSSAILNKECNIGVTDAVAVSQYLYAHGKYSDLELFRKSLLKSCIAWANLRATLLTKLSLSTLNDSLILILMQKNLGDSIGLLSLVKAIGKKYSRKVVLVADDTNIVRSLVEMFAESQIRHVLFLKGCVSLFYKPSFLLQPIEPGVPATLSVNPPGKVIPCKSSLDFDATGSHFDLYRLKLGLNSDSEIMAPVISQEHSYSAVKRALSYRLVKSKTVLISNYSNSLEKNYNASKVFQGFWVKVIEKLTAKGFCVALNDANHGDVLELGLSGVPVNVPVSEIIPFVNWCGYFLGIRSGLADVLAFSAAKRVVLYPGRGGFLANSLSNFGVIEYLLSEHDANVVQIISEFD